jgi:hypothetical protein
MDLDAVADELYGLSPDEFIPIRTAREKQARADGERESAAEIHQLSKPNVVAWLVNQLARQRRDDIRTLLKLGSELREATANLSGERLRELSRRQRQIVQGLIRHAEQLATAADRKVNAETARGLEETLYAALADPTAAAAIAAGRLTAGLRSSGFATLESTGDHQARSVTKRQPGAGPQSRPNERRGVKERERAKAQVARAELAAGEAAQARQDAHASLQEAEQMMTDANDRVEQLRNELHEAVETKSMAEKDQRRAQSAFDRADRKAEDAHQHLIDATAELDRKAR